MLTIIADGESNQIYVGWSQAHDKVLFEMSQLDS